MFVILLRKHSFLREYYFPLPPILKVTGIHYKEFLNFIKYTGGQSVTFWDLPHPVVPRGFLPPPPFAVLFAVWLCHLAAAGWTRAIPASRAAKPQACESLTLVSL